MAHGKVELSGRRTLRCPALGLDCINGVSIGDKVIGYNFY